MTPAEIVKRLANTAQPERYGQRIHSLILAAQEVAPTFPHDGFWSVEVRHGEIVAVIKLVVETRDVPDEELA